MLLVCLPIPGRAAEDVVRVQVADPFLDIRTGPGRGFPIVTVAERGEWVQILKRRTDWFKIRTEKGKEGWANRTQMEATLTEGGVQLTFRDVLLEDYLRRRVEAGVAVGQFEVDTALAARLGYRLSDNLGAEFTLSQAVGDFSSSRLTYFSLVSYPFPDWRIAPFFSLGAGQFRNEPKATLVGAHVVSERMANAGIGFHSYLTRNFVLRWDYKTHIVFVDTGRTNEYNEWTLGFSIFF
jgi:uncharacterized protein YraI